MAARKSVNHTSRAHAKLSPSGAKRWLACTPSAVLESKFKDEDSVYAREGTLAHEFADVALRLHVKQITEEQAALQREELRADALYTSEMEGQVDKYVTYVLEQYSAALAFSEDAQLRVEERISYAHYVQGGYGTTDAAVVGENTLEVIDFKYGKGVAVEAEENPQLKLYALGTLRKVELLFNIEWVRLTVVQPRLNSISSWDVRAEDLRAWARDEVQPRAELAHRGLGRLVAGDHCRFCKAKAKCRAYAELNNRLAALDFAEPQLLTDAELLGVYEALPRLQRWAEAVQKYMYEEALAGRPPNGFKLVQGRSRRAWSDENEVKARLAGLGFDEADYIKYKLKGIGDVSDLMALDDFEEHLGDLVVRKNTKPALVPETDKRPALNPIEDAKADFAE